MKLIKQEKISTQISDQYVWNFTIPKNGVYIVSISARCKNWLQNYKLLFNDDDLAIQIDDYLFAEIKGKKREFVSSGSWNGNEIKGDIKNVLFILPIKTGEHQIRFWVDGHPILEEIKIYKVDESEIDLMASDIITSGKFLDVIFKNLKIEKLEVKAKAEINSNLEIKIDGKTEKNSKYKRFEKWYWYGQELKGKNKDYIMSDVLYGDMHSVQMGGQGKPEIESIKLKIDLDNIVYSSGFVKLYKDIVIRDDVNLRSDHTDESESLLMLRDGEKVNILNENVKGKYIENLSEIWHEVVIRGIRGYILSSYVEIEGQEREKIIDLIKEKCNQYDVDANLMLAIASQESHFKPFAKSGPDISPMGIFQLSKDTRTDTGVLEAYNFYQNVEGGVKHYKWLEKEISGRGDILERRLVAWHDGTKNIKNKKSVNYNELSTETKSFIKNVLANLEKKDWYHIIYIPTIILFFVSFHLFWRVLPQKSVNVQTQTAGVVNSSVPITYLGDSEKIIYSLPEANKNKGISFSSVFDGEKYESNNYYSYSPNVFLDETNNKVFFINFNKKVIEKMDINRLDLDKISGVTEDTITPDWPNYTHIGSVVLENPENIFYFFATNSYSCGASNCNFVFYSLNINKNELRVIDNDIFGEISGLYLSPDSKYIAVVSESSGGFCNNHGDIKVFNTTTFAAQQPDWFLDDKFGTQTIKNIIWKNDDEIEFQAEYQYDCRTGEFLQTTWTYNLSQKKLTKIKSQTIERPTS